MSLLITVLTASVEPLSHRQEDVIIVDAVAEYSVTTAQINQHQFQPLDTYSLSECVILASL